MNIYIVIPAHNEAAFIGNTLQSLTEQSLLPKRIVVVDDNSTDNTAEIATDFANNFPFISVVKTNSHEGHLPGSKIIHAFYKGFDTLDENFDIICKFDADLIFPKDYLKNIVKHFESDSKIGMVGGFCTVETAEGWKLENLTGKDHVRGALKAYRRECFRDIGGLKPSMGWDTVDELLAQFHGWEVKTDESLLVKHLKPTGISYNKQAKLKQGQAFYKLRYGFGITFIASLKLAFKKGKPMLVKEYLQGYFHAKASKMPYLVSKKEGAFIRKLRVRKMISKLLK